MLGWNSPDANFISGQFPGFGWSHNSPLNFVEIFCILIFSSAFLLRLPEASGLEIETLR